MAVIRKYVKCQNLKPTPSTHEENASYTNGTMNSSTAEHIEKLANSQIECLDILKILPPFGKIKEKTSSRKYQTTAKCIFELLGCLRRAETVQRNINTERKRDQDLHNSTKEGILNVLPSLENIILVMKQFKKQRSFNITLLNELCDELNENIVSLKSVNVSPPALTQSTTQDGIVELVRNGMTILDKLVANVFSCVEKSSRQCYRKRSPYLRTNFLPGSYRNQKRRKRSLYSHSTSRNDEQSDFQSPSSSGLYKRQDFREVGLENDPSCVLSYEKFSDNQIMPSPVQNAPQRMSKRSRNLSSSSDGTVYDDLSQKTGSASISSRATSCATFQNNELKNPAFLPPSSDHLSQYRLRQMGQNSQAQSYPLSKTWKHGRTNNISNGLSSFSPSNSGVQDTSNDIVSEEEITETSIKATTGYQRNVMTQQNTASANKRSQEPSLLDISRKRLKLSKSLASPSSTISNTSSVSLQNSSNKQPKHNKTR